ncbi:MAG: hypothetical protein H6868_08280 [Rhodospirillales bacterium]|nr:hypothetical protein [Rhodospirillales bacterium]
MRHGHILRIAIAATAAAFCTAPVTGWLYEFFSSTAPYRAFPWGPRAHLALVSCTAFVLFSAFFSELPNLPRLIAAGLATYASIHFIADDVHWVLGGALPEFAQSFGFGLVGLFLFVSWFGLLRLPKLSWLIS